MRILLPADKNFMADLLWLQTCYYFGDYALKDREYPLLDDHLQLIIALAPDWRRPYFFGGVIFPLEIGDVDKGIEFLNLAIKRHPDVWAFPFYKGAYLMIYKNDLITASKLMHRAALLPGSPQYLARLSATLATKARQKEMALRFLQEALDNTDDPEQRDIILEKFQDLIQDDYSS